MKLRIPVRRFAPRPGGGANVREAIEVVRPFGVDV
jgi:hypothetical protein